MGTRKNSLDEAILTSTTIYVFRGGSNEYPQSIFLSKNKDNNVYPCKPQFYYIKVGLRGSKLYRYMYVFMMVYSSLLLVLVTREGCVS